MIFFYIVKRNRYVDHEGFTRIELKSQMETESEKPWTRYSNEVNRKDAIQKDEIFKMIAVDPVIM